MSITDNKYQSLKVNLGVDTGSIEDLEHQFVSNYLSKEGSLPDLLQEFYQDLTGSSYKSLPDLLREYYTQEGYTNEHDYWKGINNGSSSLPSLFSYLFNNQIITRDNKKIESRDKKTIIFRS